jgi:hypothetical protein
MQTTPTAPLSTPRARQLAEGIAGRLFNDGAIDLSDSELHRVLAPCVGGTNLVNAAKQLRDAGMLTLAEEWIAKRHRHAADPGAVCHCDTPDVAYNRGTVVIVNAPYHAAHGMRARITKRETLAGRDVYTVRVLGKYDRTKDRRAVTPAFDFGELTPSPGCEECNFRGWLEMTEEDHDTRRIERCDCQTLATDDAALNAALASGWKPEECRSCWSPKCGLCGWCHECDDDDVRRECDGLGAEARP